MKKPTPKHGAKFLFGLIALLYPLLVFCALVVFKLPIRYLSLLIVIFAIVYVFINRRHYKGKHTASIFISPIILCGIGSISLFTESPLVLKLYPALADLAYLTVMITSFFMPPPLAYYFIELFDKTMKDKIPPQQFERYCVRASVVWCVFFVIDGIIALITVYLTEYRGFSEKLWGIYNGGISYVLMGLIFAGEFVVLKLIEKQRRAIQNPPGENNDNP